MTPSLASIYEELVAAAAERLPDLVAEHRAAFARRVGAFTPSDPWFEERSAALWDRVLTDRRVVMALAPGRRAAEGLARGQRGLFETAAAENRRGAIAVDLLCAVTGAAFRLAPADAFARDLGLGALAALGGARGGSGAGLLDARVVATAEGIALMPGVLAHPAEATEAIRAIVVRARAFGMSNDVLLDSLLAMRHELAARSRMKPRQVYRVEALERAR